MIAALLVGGGAAFGGWYFFGRSGGDRPDLLTHTIKKERLVVTITERGGLEPAESDWITCKVKSKTPGANANATSIRWVADNGTFVKKGDKILELDDSGLQDQKETQQIAVLTAESDWKTAELTRSINLLTNQGAVQTQENNRAVAKIALDEYVSGIYQQTRIDLLGKVTMSKSDLGMWEERSAWSERMSQRGRQFVTPSQAEADQARKLSADLTKKNLETQLEVLDKLTLEKNRKTLQGTIDEAQRALEREQTKLRLQKESDDVIVATKLATYNMQLSKLQEINKEIDDCFVRSPRDGMIVYYVEERARFSGSTAGLIAQGEGVKEGQKLLSVPDLNQMVVNARVHESMVPKVKADVMKETHFSDAINSSMLINENPLVGLSAYTTFLQDWKTDFSVEHRRQERQRLARGLDANIRVNSFPDKPLRGHVKMVDPVASQNDFFMADVKVYKTLIAVDESLEGLKPGMDAVVTIFVDSKDESVLTIPLQAVLGTVEMGSKRHCFVKKSNGDIEKREVTLGLANEKVAEVKEGLDEGDTVILNPAVLLSEKERLEYGVLPSQRGGPGAPGQGGWKGKGGPGAEGGGDYPQKGGGKRSGRGGGMQGGAPGGGFKGGKGGAPGGG